MRIVQLNVCAFFLFARFGICGGVQIVQDNRGELEFVITQENYQVDTSGAWARINCALCQAPVDQGAPELPLWSGLVISQPKNARARFKVESSKRVQLKKRIRPVPHMIDPSNTQYILDEKLFSQASHPTYNLSLASPLRGVPVQTLKIPLASYLWKTGEVTLYTKIRVKILFSNTMSTPTDLRLPAFDQYSVLNPKGGRYNIKKKQILAKRGSGTSALSPSLPDRVLKISIGERNVVQTHLNNYYELSYNTIQDANIEAGYKQSISGLPTKSIHLYTGPLLIEEKIVSLPVPGRLSEVPIEVVDKNDNQTFDEGDAIRFYGHGVGGWGVNAAAIPTDSAPVIYRYISNPYSFYHSYYLALEGATGGGRRLTALSRKDPVASSGLSASWHYLRAEEDKMLGLCDYSYHTLDKESGKEWYWYITHPNVCQEGFSGSTRRTFSGNQISLPGQALPAYEQGTKLFFDFQTVKMTTFDDFDIFLPGGEATYVGGSGETGAQYVYSGEVSADKFAFKKVVWAGSNLGFDGYTVVYKRRHRYVDGSFSIFPHQFDKDVNYQLSGAPSDLVGLKLVNGVASGKLTLSKKGVFTDNAGVKENVQYFFFRPRDVQSIDKSQLSMEVTNISTDVLNDFKSGNGQRPEYLIITPKAFLPAALELKAHRMSSKLLPLKTSVVLVEDIYRQYSGGEPSPVGIRDFIRWVYHGFKSRTQVDSTLKYVLLFGDGYYDYRNISVPLSYGPNYIPPYQHLDKSTDDYFVYLDSADVIHSAARIDVAIGRVPVSNVGQADGYVDKVKAYENPEFGGVWRNRIISAADDNFQRNQSGNIDGIPHTYSANQVTGVIQEKDPGKMVENIFLLDYERNFAFSKPDAAQDLLNKINSGALIVNYFGHGSWDVWADEGLLVLDKAIPQLSNSGKNALFCSFSCTVGRFDKTSADGISESFVRLPNNGAISAISATRVSNASPNEKLAKNFFRILFSTLPNGHYPTIGDALKSAKWISSNIPNNEKYGIFGEPVLILRRPDLRVTVKKYPKTIRGLDCGYFEGTVKGGSGQGKVFVGVYGESKEKIYPAVKNGSVTLVNEQKSKIPGETLFSAVVPYVNGNFKAQYIIKERLPFGDSNAVIRAFAWDEKKQYEGSWVKDGFLISGQSNACSISDEKGPQIIITGCNRVQTSLVDFPEKIRVSAPFCFEIGVIDSTGGVSTAKKPDEGTIIEIEKEIDGVMRNFQSPILPSLSEDGFSRKLFKWDLEDGFQPGKYLLKVRAQDGFGNASARNQLIEVVTDTLFQIYKVLNAPNPLKGRGTCFYFGNVARQGTGEFYIKTARQEADIRIYNQSGLLVQHLKNVDPRTSIERFDERSCRERDAWWDGRDFWGKRLGNGPYYYKVRVKLNNTETPENSQFSSKEGVLVISR